MYHINVWKQINLKEIQSPIKETYLCRTTIAPSNMIHSFCIFEPIYGNQIHQMLTGRNLEIYEEKLFTIESSKFGQYKMQSTCIWIFALMSKYFIPLICQSRNSYCELWSSSHQITSNCHVPYHDHHGEGYPRRWINLHALEILLQKLQHLKRVASRL